jgi:hypothetical protein
VDDARSITVIVLKAPAVGASIISILLGIIGVLEVEVQVTFLGVGLAALAIASLSEVDA